MSEEDYVYDDAGNLTSKTVNGVTTTYTYDDIDQLLSESRTGYSATYTYDANGNRTSKTLGGVTENYTNDDADKLTEIKVGGSTVKSFGYDTAGRTTSVVTGAGTTTVAYDYEGRISTITYPSTATNTFTYNGLDTRVSKVDSAGTATYKRDGAHVTAPVIGDGSAAYTPGVSERRSSTTKFYGADRLGTNSVETNTSQAVTATKTYDAFGMLVASTGSSASPFGFAGGHGYQEDVDSGLKLLGHRYYDASTGRFLTRDPIKDGRNWYTYCENNPVTWIDPDGQTLILPLADILRLADPGSHKFDSEEQAAVFAIAISRPISVRTGKEWGGWIYKDGDKYRITPPRTDNINDSVDPGPRPDGATATYHIHGFKNLEISDRTGKPIPGNTLLSRPDVQFGKDKKVNIYMGDRFGGNHWWDPVNLKQKPLVWKGGNRQ